MFGIGHQELNIVFVIIFFIFGAKRLPELGKSLGLGIRGFKNAMAESPQIEASHEVNNHKRAEYCPKLRSELTGKNQKEKADALATGLPRSLLCE